MDLFHVKYLPSASTWNRINRIGYSRRCSWIASINKYIIIFRKLFTLILNYERRKNARGIWSTWTASGSVYALNSSVDDINQHQLLDALEIIVNCFCANVWLRCAVWHCNAIQCQGHVLQRCALVHHSISIYVLRWKNGVTCKHVLWWHWGAHLPQ